MKQTERRVVNVAKEYSAGAVVYTILEGDPHFALVVERNGDCGLPKGHLEQGETEHQAALREIWEELGLAVEILPDFRHTVSYTLRNGNLKTVTYFLARYEGQTIRVDKREVSDAYLLPYDSAYAALKFPKSKRTLELANQHLLSINTKNDV